jgi:hypothetical protein
MQVTINIPDHLAAEAAAHGLAVDAYVEEVLAKRIQGTVENDARKSAVEEMQKFARKHGATLGDLKLKDLIHEGHKY